MTESEKKAIKKAEEMEIQFMKMLDEKKINFDFDKEKFYNKMRDILVSDEVIEKRNAPNRTLINHKFVILPPESFRIDENDNDLKIDSHDFDEVGGFKFWMYRGIYFIDAEEFFEINKEEIFEMFIKYIDEMKGIEKIELIEEFKEVLIDYSSIFESNEWKKLKIQIDTVRTWHNLD